MFSRSTLVLSLFVLCSIRLFVSRASVLVVLRTRLGVPRVPTSFLVSCQHQSPERYLVWCRRLVRCPTDTQGTCGK